MKTGRELTSKEKQQIRRSVIHNCANYDVDYQICLPEDATCCMMTNGFTTSEPCRYYAKAVLPIEPQIQTILSDETEDMTICGICGRPFPANHNQKYCSKHCSETARRKAGANRAKNYRKNKHTA